MEQPRVKRFRVHGDTALRDACARRLPPGVVHSTLQVFAPAALWEQESLVLLSKVVAVFKLLEGEKMQSPYTCGRPFAVPLSEELTAQLCAYPPWLVAHLTGPWHMRCLCGPRLHMTCAVEGTSRRAARFWSIMEHGLLSPITLGSGPWTLAAPRLPRPHWCTLPASCPCRHRIPA